MSHESATHLIHTLNKLFRDYANSFFHDTEQGGAGNEEADQPGVVPDVNCVTSRPKVTTSGTTAGQKRTLLEHNGGSSHNGTDRNHGGTTSQTDGDGNRNGTTSQTDGDGNRNGTTSQTGGDGNRNGTTSQNGGDGNRNGTTSQTGGDGNRNGTTSQTGGDGNRNGTTSQNGGDGNRNGTTSQNGGDGNRNGTTSQTGGDGNRNGTASQNGGGTTLVVNYRNSAGFDDNGTRQNTFVELLKKAREKLLAVGDEPEELKIAIFK